MAYIKRWIHLVCKWPPIPEETQRSKVYRAYTSITLLVLSEAALLPALIAMFQAGLSTRSEKTSYRPSSLARIHTLRSPCSILTLRSKLTWHRLKIFIAALHSVEAKIKKTRGSSRYISMPAQISHTKSNYSRDWVAMRKQLSKKWSTPAAVPTSRVHSRRKAKEIWSCKLLQPCKQRFRYRPWIPETLGA